jgi:Secretion system C-terminal sorting domain/Copper type II ascorbate-dependent monooxygenase, C-terminal domain
MKKSSTLFIFAAIHISSQVQAQITYNDVAPIFYTHCTSCHHDGGIGPMPFTSYDEISIWTSKISDALQGKHGILMPPFRADTAYSTSGYTPHRFLDEKTITVSEKNAILSWIGNGALEGDVSLAPMAPTYGDMTNKLNGVADLEVGVGPYNSNASTSLVAPINCFTVPAVLTQDRWLRAFEIIPGNSAIVHHVNVNVDSTASIPSNLAGNCSNAGGQIVLGSWLPGADPTIFPSDPSFRLGIRIPAGSNFIFNVHYLPGSGGKLDDNTRIRLFFYPVGTTGIRPIHTDAMLQQWDLAGNIPGSAGSIPANTVKTYTGLSANSAQIPHAPQPATAITLLSAAGHSHKICTKIKVYAFKTVDTIPVLRINDWDDAWQGFYTYTKPVKIPAGYTLKSEHVYDNTVNNPHVLGGTPVKTNFGANPVTNEMLSDSFQWLDYQAGDENMDMKALVANDTLLRVGIKEVGTQAMQTYIYPNPASDNMNVYLSKKSTYIGRLYNIAGQTVLNTNTFNEQINMDVKQVPHGLYILEITDTKTGGRVTKKIIITH